MRILTRYESSLFFYHDVTFCRCTWLLGKGHGEQYANKPKSNTRHTASKSYRPHNRSPRHVPPYTSITEQVWNQRAQFAFTLVCFVWVFFFVFLQEMPVDMRKKIELNWTSHCFNRGTLPMNSRNMLNHSQVGQGIGMSGRTNSMGSSGLGSPNRSSPSIICMPKQQPARQPFTINR